MLTEDVHQALLGYELLYPKMNQLSRLGKKDSSNFEHDFQINHPLLEIHGSKLPICTNEKDMLTRAILQSILSRIRSRLFYPMSFTIVLFNALLRS